MQEVIESSMQNISNGLTSTSENGFFDFLNWNVGALSIGNVLFTIILLVVCIIICRLLMRVIKKAVVKLHVDKSLHTFILSIIRFLLYFVVILIVAGSLGIPITSLLAILSVVGLAISLAVQDSLSNIAGGIVVLSTKPFSVGDYIEAGDKVGTVLDIGLIYTKLCTLDHKIIHIPNKLISGNEIINYSAEQVRRLELTIGVSYDDPTEAVKSAFRDAIAQIDVLDNPAPFISISAYNESYITYLIWVWVKNTDYLSLLYTQYALTEAVRKSFETYGVHMTYNHLNVHILDQPKEH